MIWEPEGLGEEIVKPKSKEKRSTRGPRLDMTPEMASQEIFVYVIFCMRLQPEQRAEQGLFPEERNEAGSEL